MKIIRPITITDAMLTSSNVPETDYAAYAAGTTYAAGNRVIVVATHKIYESLVGSNVGNYPPTDVLATTPKWQVISATNRWKPFDDKVGSQTSQATSITYQITPGEVFDSIAFLNMDAVTVRVVLTDPVAGVVYDETIDLLTTVVTGGGEVYDWYSYFFSSYFRTTDVIKFDITPYLNAVVDITITYTGGTAKCGEIVLGLQTTIGDTQYSPSIGIRDFSTKEADVYGVYSIIERVYSKRMVCDVTVVDGAVDNVESILAYYRSKPIVWVGSERYTSMIIYGFYKDHNIVISYPEYSILSIEIEGLI